MFFYQKYIKKIRFLFSVYVQNSIKTWKKVGKTKSFYDEEPKKYKPAAERCLKKTL